VRVLFLTFYFRPDLCAGSFRATPLVEALVARAPPAWHIDVISTLPNRYESFAVDAPEFEQHGRLTVRRIALPAHQSGMLDQSKAFLAFARAVRRVVAHERYELVVATSSRLMTAALAAEAARRSGARLYLDIRDIFADTIGEVLPRTAALLAQPLFSIIERRTVERADCVNLVSPGFAPYFQARYPVRRFSYFTNGIDDEFLAIDSGRIREQRRATAQRELTIVYAGNIGEGQGLHAIVPDLARRLEGRASIKVIGDGGRRAVLEAALARAHVSNVQLLAPMSREALIAEYLAADVLFMHLNDYEAFKKVLPSKIFEYAALGKPILAGVAGYSADFVSSEISNAAVFTPCDVDSAMRAFAMLDLRDTPRPDFVAKYARSAISAAMATDIIECARNPQPKVTV